MRPKMHQMYCTKIIVTHLYPLSTTVLEVPVEKCSAARYNSFITMNIRMHQVIYVRYYIYGLECLVLIACASCFLQRSVVDSSVPSVSGRYSSYVSVDISYTLTSDSTFGVTKRSSSSPHSGLLQICFRTTLLSVDIHLKEIGPATISGSIQ